MSTAFALTLAHLGETSARPTPRRLRRLHHRQRRHQPVGRLLAAGVVDHLGLAANFTVFAALNLAAPCWSVPTSSARRRCGRRHEPTLAGRAWRAISRHPALRSAFAIGFLILFAFIGTFTYVNFVLVRPPFGIGMMMLGLVYFVFLPSIVTTPLAGRVVARFGTRPTLWASFALRPRACRCS